MNLPCSQGGLPHNDPSALASCILGCGDQELGRTGVNGDGAQTESRESTPETRLKGADLTLLFRVKSFKRLKGQSDHPMLATSTSNNQSGLCECKEKWEMLGGGQGHLRRLLKRRGKQSVP